MSIKVHHSRRTAAIIRDNNLPTQGQLNSLEIRFNNCVITYKLKHIETQASKSRWRKIGKSFGFSFRSLRTNFQKDENELFSNCTFNPSDRSIVKEHIKNLETPTIRFVNCKFLRRDSSFTEDLIRSWRRHRGQFIKFTGKKGLVDVDNDILRLKDLPSSVEFIITRGKDFV